jgi:serine/threonine-protein kinase HipA
MSWARQAGFEVPECRFLPSTALLGTLGEHAEPDTHVLMVRRFDRANGTKIHQEDFAQVINLPPKHKYDHVSYEQLAKLTEALIDGAARDELIRRLVFMIASGNGDAHLKNWSLVYPDRVHAQLSPLYDQVATVAWPELDRKLALGFAGTKAMSQLDHGRVRLFAERGGFDVESVLTLVDETLESLAHAWAELSCTSEWTMPAAHVDALREHWQQTPLLRDSALTR